MGARVALFRGEPSSALSLALLNKGGHAAER